MRYNKRSHFFYFPVVHHHQHHLHHYTTISATQLMNIYRYVLLEYFHVSDPHERKTLLENNNKMFFFPFFFLYFDTKICFSIYYSIASCVKCVFFLFLIHNLHPFSIKKIQTHFFTFYVWCHTTVYIQKAETKQTFRCDYIIKSISLLSFYTFWWCIWTFFLMTYIFISDINTTYV